MVEAVRSRKPIDSLKRAKINAEKAINDFKKYPRIYVEFAKRADELKKQINDAKNEVEVNRIMSNAHKSDRWDLA